MRKRIAMVALGVATFGAPATSNGTPVEGAHTGSGLRKYEQSYLEVRSRYIKEFGLRSAGRNIVREGYREDAGDVRPATRPEVIRSAERMEATLTPPAAAATDSGDAGYTGGTSGSTAQCESGGDYSAVNPAGYYGAYQFDQSTWDAYAPSGYEGVNPASAPPPVQDAAAASVPYDAWPSCP
jgi:hypothetical protein